MTVKRANKKSLFIKGDKILTINGNAVFDALDIAFFENEESLTVEILRGEKTISLIDCSLDGLQFVSDALQIMPCQNNCIFCFVDALPKDKLLRQSLRVKDDDYRQSFLHGNFITLSNVKKEQLERIKRLKLSPLYISVHTTSPSLRGEMLGLKKEVPILDKIKELYSAGIELHTQIVYCPNINEDYKKTAIELAPFCKSLGIVPVGLTNYSNAKLEAVCSVRAKKVLETVGLLQKQFLEEYSKRFIFAADEFYLKAENEIPKREEYEEFYQEENGIGLLRLFEDDFFMAVNSSGKIKLKKEKIFVVTGELSYKFILEKAKFLEDKFRACVEVVKITNSFFGNSVTVSGLMTASDIIDQLSSLASFNKICKKAKRVLIPSNAFKAQDTVMLDGITVNEIKKRLNARVEKVAFNGESFVQSVLGIK